MAVMNRHDRRAAVARARRGHRPGYTHRLLAGLGNGMLLKAGVHHVAIEHDGWRSIYRGGSCDCCPNISVSGPDGVVIIDERGVSTKRARS
jgi:hypothetical protein